MLTISNYGSDNIEIALNDDYEILNRYEAWKLFREITNALETLVPFLEKPHQIEAITYLAETAAFLNKTLNEKEGQNGITNGTI